MSHSNITMKLVQILRCKNFTDKSHVFIVSDITVLTDCDAAAFLPAMLQRKKTVIYPIGNIFTLQIISAEDAAFFVKFIFYICTAFTAAFILKLLFHNVLLIR